MNTTSRSSARAKSRISERSDEFNTRSGGVVASFNMPEKAIKT